MLKKFNLGPDWWKRYLTFAASSTNNEDTIIPIPSDTPHIGGSICYKQQIAELLNDAAQEFGWKYDPHTLELKKRD